MNIDYSIFIKRDNLLIKVISFFWIIAKVILLTKLMNGRQIPAVPLLSFLPFQFEIPIVLLFTGTLLLISLLIFKVKPHIILLLILNEVILILYDYIFLQPWEFLYLITFLFYFIYNNKINIFNNLINSVLALLYISAGLHKLNRDFLHNVWQKMILNNYFHITDSVIISYKLFFIGLLIPLIEIALGVGLLFSKQKKLGTILLVLMHLLILLFIGPLGLNYNSMVWPWNIAMIFILVINYYNHTIKSKTISNLTLTMGLFLTLLIATGTKSYLTFNLYSGKNPRLIVQSKKPLLLYNSIQIKYNGIWYVDAIIWAQDDIGIPLCPETWYIKKVKDKIAEQYPNISTEIR